MEVKEFAELTGPGINSAPAPFHRDACCVRRWPTIARPNEVFLGYVDGAYLTRSPAAGYPGRAGW